MDDSENNHESFPQSWDELIDEYGEERKANKKKKYSKKHHSSNELTDPGQRWRWMVEPKYKQMFDEIEQKIQGAIGVGKFEWVDRRVFDQVFDRMTLLGVYKLMQAGEIGQINWPIARGKEAHVFHGLSDDGVIAIKIFHTSNAVFKNLLKYIEGDPRFGGLKRKHRDLVTVWVRKEHRNLLRMKKCGLNVPEPLGIHQNILVMSYIGDDEKPAPRLRDVKINNPEEVFEKLKTFIRICWHEAKLVHADFSDYNILWHNGEPVVIDVGQAVSDKHPHAKEFLVRDVQRLIDWGSKQGLDFELAEILYDIIN
ncbi:MAG: serine protein kinase RIO [Euryarchaeota archaeon]|nr:serine protein kinase RIO [Euryarchaeota archaeon]|tara:strand:+ start:957 stop:1889 length:933 start_codon:yes stop_codon:yes gene_type:complete